ncbi:NAD-dependent epimerase/dehydratase family protein [Streptomyces sp. NPDC093586]|uniref:NAD-dependent epimerase/dehydratase family protein n=1 Tax=Streptomyces sp. NPDC093586 TaxID=3366042 RepID=UPI0037F39BD9
MTALAHPDHPPAPGDTPGTVLVVGGTGFIGSAVLRALARHQGPRGGAPTLLALCRKPPRTGLPGVRYAAGDLTDPTTLRGVCSGVTTVVHAASYVGRDSRQCREINHTGTRALLDEARRHEVRRFLYVSTASVYGTGPHRGIREGQLDPSPASAASASRLLAEEDVRAAGATVLRPPLVYGVGDRWFVPALAHLLRRVPSWPDGPHARTSVVAVEDLARITAALVRQPHPARTAGGTYHVADPRPLPWGDLLARLRTLLHLPQAPPVPLAEHRSLVRRSLPDLSDHQYSLLTEDHWYDTERIWRSTGLRPGPGFGGRFAACSAWYARQLRHATA